MQSSHENGKNQGKSVKKGFSLPTTSSKPPMPPVKQPKKEGNK